MFREGMFPSEVGDSLGLHPRLIRKWRTDDREFDLACIDAEEGHNDTLEREAIRRARDGVLEPIISRGQLVVDPTTGGIAMQRRYSDSLLMFILKGRRRAVYGDKLESDVHHSFNPEGSRRVLESRLAQIEESERTAGVPQIAE